MSSEKATALVLRVVEFSESSSVVTLFTREFGKVRGLAKGARRQKSPFESALDLLSLCRIVFLRKSSDALDLLTEAKLERRFRAAGRDLSRLYAAYYVAELLAELTDDGDPHPELFDVACDALAALGAEGSHVATVLLRFELNALRLLGHMPLLDACVECGRPVDGQERRIAFGQLSGGVLCPRCRPGKRQVVSISGAALRAMKRLAAGDQMNHNAEPIDRRTSGELRGLLNQYVCNLLGRKPRMHAYLAHLAD
jgi:DNA repair protein RecO (recombination protein O)